jgi:hypothetical protein
MLGGTGRKYDRTMFKPWSTVNDDELKLLLELEEVCRHFFQPKGSRMHQASIPDRLHEILDRLEKVNL